MKTNSVYWQKRFQAIEDMNNKAAKETIRSVTPAFDKAQAQIEKEINAWYARFAKNNEISLTEAKKLLNTRELKEFRWDVEEYIKYGRQNALDQKWMKQLENASSRFHISRLEALKIRTQNAAERAFGNELDMIDEMAARTYIDDYYHTAYEIQKGLGIGWDVSKIDQRRLDNVLSKPWTTDKMTFSDRIWKSKTQLIDSLHTELTQMCILGKAPDEAIKNIAKRMDVSKGQAGRLIMTESAYFGSVAQKDCFNDLDVEKYEIIATLDSHTSDICQQMDGKVFDMKDFEAGVTAPPFHVWCRSCTAPYFDDMDDMRAARDEDGKTYYVPSDMKYEDWKNSFVEGGTKDDLVEVFQPLSDYKNKDGTFDLERAKEDYQKFLTTVPENSRIYLQQSFEAVSYEQKTLETSSFGYSKSKDTICYDPNSLDFDSLDFVIANTHELSHRIDHHFVKSFENESFRDAIELSKSIINANPGKFTTYCFDNDKEGFISDIMSAICEDEYRFPFYHESDYWEAPGNKEMEIFANMFSLESINDKSKLKFLRKNFPDLMKAYKGLMLN